MRQAQGLTIIEVLVCHELHDGGGEGSIAPCDHMHACIIAEQTALHACTYAGRLIVKQHLTAIRRGMKQCGQQPDPHMLCWTAHASGTGACWFGPALDACI